MKVKLVPLKIFSSMKALIYGINFDIYGSRNTVKLKFWYFKMKLY